MGLTAAEYVLGVLGAEQRRAAERRIAATPPLRARSPFGKSGSAGLLSAVPEVAPPRRLWSRIEAALGRGG